MAPVMGVALTTQFAASAAGGATPLIGYGMIFGFTSFIGFEAAAVLGEETREPRRAIPKAILGAVIFAGVFYILVRRGIRGSGHLR